jgi:hypothetical protein
MPRGALCIILGLPSSSVFCRGGTAPALTSQGAVSIAATKAVSPVQGAASSRGAVKLFLTSLVRENCTLRSLWVPGAGDRPWRLGGSGRPLSLPRPQGETPETAKEPPTGCPYHS